MKKINKKENVAISEFKSVHDKIDVSVRLLNQKIDGTAARLDHKINNLAVDVSDVKVRLKAIEHNMLTKKDKDEILNRIDHFAKQNDVYSKKAMVHDYRLLDLEDQYKNHEKRISALEATGK